MNEEKEEQMARFAAGWMLSPLAVLVICVALALSTGSSDTFAGIFIGYSASVFALAAGTALLGKPWEDDL